MNDNDDDNDPEAVKLELVDLTIRCFQKDVNVIHGGEIVYCFSYIKTLLHCRVMYYQLWRVIAVSRQESGREQS